MSRFSGKYDLYDWFFMSGNHNLDYIKRSKIYLSYSFEKETCEVIPGEQLHVETIKDLIPYYPYIISMGTWSKDGCTVYLCEKPYPDMLWDKLGHKPLMYDYYKEELNKELAQYENAEGENENH